MASLENKIIVVTGAASGIGRASVLKALGEGALIIAVDSDQAGLEGLRGEAGERMTPAPGDVTDDGFARAVIERAVAAHGRLDGLATIAGISESGVALCAIEPEVWDRIFEINVKATWRWMCAAVPAMRAGGGGSIVTVASQLAFAGGRLNAAYIASKGAVVSLTKTAAVELAEDGIRVNAVAPGATDTPLMQRGLSRQADPAAARERSRDRHAMQRFGRPEEIANGICWLLSDEAGFATGSTLVLDGGWLAA